MCVHGFSLIFVVLKMLFNYLCHISMCKFIFKLKSDYSHVLFGLSGKQTDCANAIAAGDKYIFVGCANGLVRVFSAASLNFIASMPAPHYLGVDVAAEVPPKCVFSACVVLYGNVKVFFQ